MGTQLFAVVSILCLVIQFIIAKKSKGVVKIIVPAILLVLAAYQLIPVISIIWSANIMIGGFIQDPKLFVVVKTMQYICPAIIATIIGCVVRPTERR